MAFSSDCLSILSCDSCDLDVVGSVLLPSFNGRYIRQLTLVGGFPYYLLGSELATLYFDPLGLRWIIDNDLSTVNGFFSSINWFASCPQHISYVDASWYSYSFSALSYQQDSQLRIVLGCTPVLISGSTAVTTQPNALFNISGAFFNTQPSLNSVNLTFSTPVLGLAAPVASVIWVSPSRTTATLQLNPALDTGSVGLLLQAVIYNGGVAPSNGGRPVNVSSAIQLGVPTIDTASTPMGTLDLQITITGKNIQMQRK